MHTTDKRIALVTGANRGIGLEIARQLAEKGLQVLLAARDRDKGDVARQHLVQSGLDVHLIELDVSDPMSVAAAIGRIGDSYGRLDALVNNAGIMIDGNTAVLELPLAVLQNTLDTNSFGPLLLSQGCARLMQRRRYGRIVNISSTLGSLTEIADRDSLSAAMQSPAYRLSKALLNGITLLLSRELRDDNILVNSACPGWVRTELGGPEAPVSPEEAADTPVWLATLEDDGPTGGFFRERKPLPW